MSERPRTMTAEYEAKYRKLARDTGLLGSGEMSRMFAELDAEREAHDASEQTIREQCAKLLDDGQLLQAHIGPLFNAGWNAAVRHFAAAIRSGK